MKISLLLITVVLLSLSLIGAPYPHEQALQHAPTAVAIVALAVCIRNHLLSTASIACLSFLLWLHILGARYIYSFVPYDEWMNSLFGISLSDWLGWQRNHFDRLVHFCFGALFLLPAIEVGMKYANLSLRMTIFCGICTIMTISALYEVFEWMIAVTMAPHYAERYNGQQGDFWDSQKDMALAFAGCLVTLLGMICFRKD